MGACGRAAGEYACRVPDPKLHPIEASVLQRRRERVFLVLAGLFLGSMTMLNILGVSRFIDLSFSIGGLTVPMPLAVGVLPYPITFLCTDFLSEFYGHRRANFVVFVGLLINLWVCLFLWLGGVLPGAGTEADGRVFFDVRRLAFGTVAASMIAYLAAQFVDVWLFHFWKRLTRGRHLWLRNNGSTLLSQLVDTVCVVLITFWGSILAGELALAQVLALMASGYAFKMIVALLDTIPFYLLVAWLARWLDIDPHLEHARDSEAVRL